MMVKATFMVFRDKNYMTRCKADIKAKMEMEMLSKWSKKLEVINVS